MAPPPGSRPSKGAGRKVDRPDLELLAIGKRAGLTFDEIGLLRVSDLIEYARLYAGVKDDAPRRATQADIDKFYGR